MAPSTDAPTVDERKMTYRFLGDSGLLVSTLSLGSWMTYYPDSQKDAWYDVMKTAFKHGINFFDSAENYNDGRADEFMGHAIQRGLQEGVWTREDLVISAKFMTGTKFFDSGPNGQGNARKHLVEGIKSTLKKMQLDYVDVIFSHRFEKFTPIEETVRAMNFIIDQGWAFYWGTSEWPAYAVKEACDIADRLGLVRPIVEQPEYNVFERNKVEHELVDLFTTRNLGLMVWSPLAGGILTGKYAHSVPAGSRLANADLRALNINFENQVSKVRQLESVAVNLGCSLAQLAAAWCASNRNVSTVLLGARTVAQLEETVKAMAFVDQITPEIKNEIDAIVQFVPKRTVPDVFYTIRECHVRGQAERPAWGRAFKKHEG
jgi:voltage-dependent potassium channel beta subunit